MTVPRQSGPPTGKAGKLPVQSPVPTTFDRDAQAPEFGRVLAFSDGVFAIALTLLVLDLTLPDATVRGNLAQELLDRQAHFIAFAVSLLLVGSAWWSHYRLFSMFQGLNGKLIALNIAYLGMVVVIPFAQSVLAAYPNEPLAYVIFSGLLASIGLVDAWMFVYARGSGLLRASLTPRTTRFELLISAVYILTFLVSMPLAYVLGPYTVLVYVMYIPLSQWLLWLQNRETRESVRMRRRPPSWLRTPWRG
jgi:uncharacterized membrane protein